MHFFREFARMKKWVWLSVGLLLLTQCEKDPVLGIYTICDGEWTLYDPLIHHAVTDIDGNKYDAVQIGEQTWMVQNLRTTRYADGTAVFNVEGALYYIPNGDDSLGFRYNWVAAMHGANNSDADSSNVQGICPDGWHLPSDAEWTQLISYVESQPQYWYDGHSAAGKALASTSGWAKSEVECAIGNHAEHNNATWFSALPAGYASGGYDFNNTTVGVSAFFWSATECGEDHAWDRVLYHDDSGAYRFVKDKTHGLSVRCVKD